MSLYGKYRPQNFANLVGQDHIRETLLNEIKRGGLTHAYLFAGPRGTGKTSTARLIAKALNCEKLSEETEPCESCDFCIGITEGSLIDVLEIDAASNRGIEEIRDLKEKIAFAPTRAKTKVYIIDEVHMLTKEAFNALLKTLEEPPENVYFVLCTTEIHKIPETIISRCQRFDFKRIDVRTIMTRLSFIAQKEGIVSEDQAIELIARHVEGGLRDAIGLLEQMTIDSKLEEDHVREHLGITGHSTITALIELLEKRELTKALHIVNEVNNEGYDLSTFVREILECLRERLIEGIQKGKDDAVHIMEIIQHFEEAREMLRITVIPQLPLEIAVIKICGDAAQSAALLQNPGRTDVTAPDAIANADAIASAAKQSHTAQREEETTAAVLKKEIEHERFNDGEIGTHWPRVLERIEPPALRRSLADGKIAKVEDDSVILAFGSQWHMEKANTAPNRAKVEAVIKELFNKKVAIKCELSAQNKAKVQEEKPIMLKAQPAKSKPKDLAAAAMEIFGEE